MSFYLDEYKEDVVDVFTPCATFSVAHKTSVYSEEIEQDCWSNSLEMHYTRITGQKSYEADTHIISVELMLDDDVYTAVNLNNDAIAEIKKVISKAAEYLHECADKALEEEFDEAA